MKIETWQKRMRPSNWQQSKEQCMQAEIDELRAALHAQPALVPAPMPERNEWKEAVLDALAGHALDAPVTDSPKAIIDKIIVFAVQIATDPAIGGGLKLVPMTDAEIDACVYQGRQTGKDSTYDLVRAVEVHHRIRKPEPTDWSAA